jgi:hypothetical protein
VNEGFFPSPFQAWNILFFSSIFPARLFKVLLCGTGGPLLELYYSHEEKVVGKYLCNKFLILGFGCEWGKVLRFLRRMFFHVFGWGVYA